MSAKDFSLWKSVLKSCAIIKVKYKYWYYLHVTVVSIYFSNIIVICFKDKYKCQVSIPFWENVWGHQLNLDVGIPILILFMNMVLGGMSFTAVFWFTHESQHTGFSF